MNIDITLAEALKRASTGLRKKMLHSVELLQKAETIALNYDAGNGYYLLISPIIYWTEQDVWEFLNDVVRVPHCSLYDEGWHRIGCIGCPMSSHKQKMIENARYPHVKRNWIKAIKAIRNGELFKREYIWWNIRKDWMPLRNVRGLLRTQAATSSIPTPNIGQVPILQTIRLEGEYQEYEERQNRHSASVYNGCEQTTTGRAVRRNSGKWKLAAAVFQETPLLTA